MKGQKFNRTPVLSACWNYILKRNIFFPEGGLSSTTPGCCHAPSTHLDPSPRGTRVFILYHFWPSAGFFHSRLSWCHYACRFVFFFFLGRLRNSQAKVEVARSATNSYLKTVLFRVRPLLDYSYRFLGCPVLLRNTEALYFSAQIDPPDSRAGFTLILSRFSLFSSLLQYISHLSDLNLLAIHKVDFQSLSK